ncbi:MAG: dienelactone hydrolase family protein, partial [Povalibacter sp.]
MRRRTLLQAGIGATLAPAFANAARMDAKDKDQREQLYGLLGKLPARDRKVSAQILSTEDRGAYILEKLVLDLNGIESAPAYFAKPKDKSGRLPTVLFNHSHGGGYTIGKNEFIAGREYMTTPPYAEFLTSLGYNALCFDTWMFGERATRTELDTFKDMLWHGHVVWGMMVYDSLKAVDYLVTRKDVDTQRLGTLGM